MFLIPLLITGTVFPLFPLYQNLRVDDSIPPLTAMAWFVFCIGAVGFVDDFIKVRVRKSGLSASAKSLLLMVVIAAYTIYYLYFSGVTPGFILPFTDISAGRKLIEVTGLWKIPYGLFVAFVLYVTSNSVNITDGVDGLAAGVTAIVCMTLGFMGLLLNTMYSQTASLYSFAAAAGCIAFFFYNRHPAKLFMGDTGSQALGALVAAAAVLMGVPWVIVPVGIIYVMESASVLIQVSHYKRTKKRVFRMAPLHHHFELGGWSEWKVIGVFCLVTVAGCVIGLMMIL
jgi:phospho-N-acetylmuramoyl-pentapeptide-transferase